MPHRAELADLDRRIAAAYTELTVARARFALTPSGEIVTACEQAETAVNDLLDRRLASTAAAAAPPLQPA